MQYRFGPFELDTGQFRLAADGRDVHVEPLVFDLLRFFLDRAGEVVTRDDIIADVWNGRFVSDATVSSCVKSARKALGDTGEAQSYIRTVRGRGFKFVAAVERTAESTPAPIVAAVQEPVNGPEISTPPRIAVLPLFALTPDPQLAILGDAVSQEVILELSRLHWLFVIARGSSFKFRGQEVDLSEAAAILGADYVLTGTVVQQATECVISVELCHIPGNNIVWAERFVTPLADLMHMRPMLAGAIARALEPRIQLQEAMQAARIPTEQLDAWAAFHRGLWHMFRFNRDDNAQAAHLFGHAVKLDPAFARAHAGLSFTHFQNAFLGFTPDVEAEKNLMRATAGRSMELDPFDPFVNLTMGRSEWLYGNLEAGLPWMERAIDLSPNFAFAIYNSALVGTFLGEGESSERKVEKAIGLSPIDPLNYAMVATRALTHLVRGNFAGAAQWAEKAALLPNAHVQIHMIAAIANELQGDRVAAETHFRHVCEVQPAYAMPAFLKFFPFRDGALRARIIGSMQRLGVPA